MLFADGYYRRTRCYFGPTAIDYPEGALLNNFVEGNVVWSVFPFISRSSPF
jgi:hypothetical protein